MASWREFAEADPEMAALGAQLISNKTFQVAYLATLRKDGGPRVHPVCPVLAGDHIYLAIGPQSPKLADLRRDSRYMLHAMPGKGDAEFNIRGRATEGNDAATHAEVEHAAAAVGLNVMPREVIFRLDIKQAATTYWERVGQPDTRPVRRRWRA
ncbi:MAG: pyridoxamine 5'-phosphate oxidase family protein [Dehalococcoidia bacterium]